MASEQATPSGRTLQQRFEEVWGNLSGVGALSAVNHTTIGLRFMSTGAIFFLIGGLLAMLMRTQLALPEQSILNADVYNQVFTMHGTVMMFLFAIPILEGLAIYMIPKMIGARDLIFPRISAFGYYCYLFGGLILLSSLFIGEAPDSGWFMYPPLSGATFSPGSGSDFWLLGVTFVEISAIAAGVELTVSILRSRAPGMTLFTMPIFCWYMLVTALMIIFGFPPLILASIMLELERAAGMPFFEVASGGDPLLWQHLFWLFGHPEVYIIFLPGAAIVSTLIPVFSNRPLLGYRWVVVAIIFTGFISFGLWVHHMFAVGIPHLAQSFFSAASMLVAIPTGIQVFAWLATLWTGRVIFAIPMLWLFGFLVIFVAGGLTGVMLALVPFNWVVHDTHFVVAHLHYVLIGGMLFPIIAGLYYWLPHISGRMPSQSLGRWSFWLTFGGFNLTFLMMHLTGLLGMPRRVYTYEAGLGWDWLNMLSSVGSFIMAAGIAMLIVDIALHFRYGRVAPRNPWNADTLEWATSTPPGPYNFISLPTIRTRHPLWEDPGLLHSIEAGEHGLAEIEHGRRETYGSNAITGALQEVIRLPSNSWWPLASALFLAVLTISLLAEFYAASLFGLAGAVLCLLRWSWLNGAHPGMMSASEEEYNDPPLHIYGTSSPGLWGMVVGLMANGALYLSLLFGWFFLWTVSPRWTAPEQGPIGIWSLLLSGVLITLAVLLYQRSMKRLRVGIDTSLKRDLWLTSGLGLVHFAALLYALLNAELRATELTHDAVLLVMMIYLLIHGGLAALLTAMQAIRVARAYVSASVPYEPIVLHPLWVYTLAVFWLSFAAFILLPMTWPATSFAGGA